MMRRIKIWLLAFLAFGWAACKHEDLTVQVPNENIRPAADFIKNNYEMTLFSAALEKTGLKDQVNGEGPFTMLVPTDAAFNELGIFHASDLDKLNRDSLKKVISYHILPRKLALADIPENGVDIRYATLEGTEIYTSYGALTPNGGRASTLFFSGSLAARKDVKLSNGVLHVLQKVMKPHFEVTVQQWLAARADYSVFVEGLKKFGLWDQLSQTGPYTIYAPSNAALAQIGITSATIATMNKDQYNGDLLFGAYLVYNRHFFISDSEVIRIINSNGSYNYLLNDNKSYMEMSVLNQWPTGLYYQLTLRPEKGAYSFLKRVEYNVESKMDNLCSNGVIHHLAIGLATPQQAIKP